MIRHFVIAFLSILAAAVVANGQQFVAVRDGRLEKGGEAYYFVGANYWYGPLLGLEADRKRGIERLRKELDLLKKNGVTNLRVMAGAEGKGLLNNVPRVAPPLQPEQGKFDGRVLGGLDTLLAEMAKRDMTAVIFLSNNWEWSGGFQQYLIWNGVIDRKWLTEKPDWDTLRDLVTKFYACEPCKAAYAKQAEFVITRTNKITGKRYIDDPTIMAWQIANEPRPMRPATNDAYKKWIGDTAALIKRLDKNHLVSIGHEGRVGTERLSLFEEIHRDKNVDYLTIHIWPKNWAWFESGKMAEQYDKAEPMTRDYIAEHIAAAKRLNKPLVIEEFGLPRDGQSFDVNTKTTFRDRYYRTVFSYVKSEPHIAGANFWAFGGRARPARTRLFWQTGDEYTGDPPMEEQGLYSVFDRDRSTLKVIRNAARKLKNRP